MDLLGGRQRSIEIERWRDSRRQAQVILQRSVAFHETVGMGMEPVRLES